MKRGERGPSIATMIYFVVLGVLIVQELLIKGKIDGASVFMYFVITTIPYIIYTKNFNYILAFVSLSFTMFIIGSLPIAVFMTTGVEPGFIISSILMGLFTTFLFGTFVTKGHWSIKSPWVANMLGSSVLFVVEYFLFVSMEIDSQFIIGGAGLLAYLAVSIAYLTMGPSVKINEPELTDKEFSSNFMSHVVSNSGYALINFKNDENRHDTVLDKKSQYRDSLRFVFTSTPLSINREKKKNKSFEFYSNGSRKRAYPWLARELIRSSEIKRTKDVKSENVIIVVLDDEIKEPRYTTIEVPLPRSRKTVFIGQMRVPNMLNKRTTEAINKLSIELSLKNNENI